MRMALASSLAAAVLGVSGCGAPLRDAPPVGPIAEMRVLGSDLLRHTSTVVTLALSADGRRLAAGDCGGNLKVFDARSGRLLHSLQGHENTVIALALSADGTRALSGGEDGTIRLWDAVEGRLRTVARDPGGAVWSVAFTGHDRGASAGNERGDIGMVDLDRGRVVSSFRGHSDRVSRIRVLDRLRFLTAGFDGQLRLWAAREKDAERLLGRHDGAITDIAVSPDGRTAVTGGFDGRLRRWDLESETAAGVFGETKGNYFGMAFAGKNRIITVKDDGAVEVWRLPEGALDHRLAGHHDAAWCVAVGPDGRAWTGGADNTIRCWDIAGGRELFPRPGHQHEIRAVAFSPDGAQCWSEGRDGRRLAWNAASGALLGDAPPAEKAPAPRFQPLCDSATVALWDDADRVLKWQKPCAGPPVAAVARADGAFCVAISESAILLLDGATGDILAAHPDARSPTCLSLSPDGITLAVGHRDTTVALYRIHPPDRDPPPRPTP